MIPTITIEDVIKGNYTEQDLEMDLGRQLATVSGLVRVDNKNMPKVREFVKKLGAEMCKKFEVQWAGGDEERLEQLQELRLIEQEEKEVRNVIWVVFGNQQINPRGGKIININGNQLKKLYRFMQEEKTENISK